MQDAGSMDIAAMIAQLAQPGAIEAIQQATAEVSQRAMAPEPVPIRDVNPPVSLRGRIDLYITIPYDSYYGHSQEVIQQRIIDVLYGASGAWLPRIEFGDLEVWRERVREQPEPDTGGIGQQQRFGNLGNRDAGTISGTGDRRDQESAGDSPIGGPVWTEDGDAINEG